MVQVSCPEPPGPPHVLSHLCPSPGEALPTGGSHPGPWGPPPRVALASEPPGHPEEVDGAGRIVAFYRRGNTVELIGVQGQGRPRAPPLSHKQPSPTSDGLLLSLCREHPGLPRTWNCLSTCFSQMKSKCSQARAEAPASLASQNTWKARGGLHAP